MKKYIEGMNMTHKNDIHAIAESFGGFNKNTYKTECGLIRYSPKKVTDDNTKVTCAECKCKINNLN